MHKAYKQSYKHFNQFHGFQKAVFNTVKIDSTEGYSLKLKIETEEM